jgi:hypothetical protein
MKFNPKLEYMKKHAAIMIRQIPTIPLRDLKFILEGISHKYIAAIIESGRSGLRTSHGTFSCINEYTTKFVSAQYIRKLIKV